MGESDDSVMPVVSVVDITPFEVAAYAGGYRAGQERMRERMIKELRFGRNFTREHFRIEDPPAPNPPADEATIGKARP